MNDLLNPARAIIGMIVSFIAYFMSSNVVIALAIGTVGYIFAFQLIVIIDMMIVTLIQTRAWIERNRSGYKGRKKGFWEE